MPSTVRVTCSSVTLMSVLPLRAGDVHRGYDGRPSIRRGRRFRPPTAAIRAWIAATRHPRRCGPFGRHQVPDFALRQGGAEGLAEIGQRFRVAEHLGGAGAVGMRQPVGVSGRQERIVAHQFRRQRRDRRDIHVAAGQRRFAGPALLRFGAAQIGREPLQRLFGEPPIGRDLAAIDRQQRRAAGRIEFEHIIAGGGLGFAGAVVIERTNAGIGPDHILRLHGLGQIFA